MGRDMYPWRLTSFAVLVLLIACANGPAQIEGKKKPAGPRYGLDIDADNYPQKAPAEAMKSIVAAYDRRRVDYLLAQLADPAYVDYWVNRYKDDFKKGSEEGKRMLAFDRLARETMHYFENDPLIVKELRIFAKEAKWAEEGEVAIGAVEKIPARKVYLKRIGERWVLENKQQE